jgi:putative ABC transport system permease protein
MNAMLYQFVIRNIKSRPFLNLIKVIGLALGLSGILFIVLFLKNELSYDTYNPKAENIYRFTITNPRLFNNGHFARTLYSEEIPDLANYFPEIESYVRLAPIRGGVMMYNQRYYSVNEAFMSDSTFFNLFDTKLIVGNKQTILDAPGSMVISESFSKKIFGNENPVGKILSLPPGQFYDKKTDFAVKGVMKDFPQNSHFHPDLIATPSAEKISGWAWSYLLLKEHTNPDKITSGYAAFIAKRNNMPVDKVETKPYLQKLTDIHLHSDKLREIEANGNMTNIYVLAIAAIILFLISMSNYASLNLGMAGFNGKFITMNRILGSTKNMNLKYFFIESLIIILCSILITFILSIPVNNFIASQFQMNLFEGNSALITITITIFSLFGFFAGLQPVFKQYLVNLNQKANYNLLQRNNFTVSKSIIISQYALAIVLITGVIIISRQNHFALNNSMGVREDNIICFESVHADIQQKFEIFKTELLKHNSIESVSGMLEPPGGEANDMFEFELEGFQDQEANSSNSIGVFPCDYSFANLFNLKFLSGNNFSNKNVDVEGSGEFIINEAALHYLNYIKPNDIIGKAFQLNQSNNGVNIPKGKIIGVVKDFHLSSMKKKVGPLVLFKRDKLWLINFVVSYKSGMKETAITDIRTIWQNMFPEYPFIYENVGSMYRKVYKTELLQAKLLTIFTIISLVICSMGLLGISLLIAQKRVKEIGIRKVNGAQITEILVMLNKDFVKWVVIAFVIATPIAYYAMNKWLENFAYKTELSWWIFALAGLLALGIALLTVTIQSLKAATRNPVEALRYE